MHKRTQEQFRIVFNHIPVAAMLLDNFCRVERINRVAAKLFFLKSALHGGQHIDSLIKSGFIPQETKYACSPHHYHQISEVNFTTKSKKNIYLKIVAVKIKSANHHHQWVVMLEDITDAVSAKKLVSTMTNRILQAHEEEKQMLSREIHDTLSQSLAALKMSIQSNSDKHSLVQQVDQLIQVSRTLSQNLRPEVIDKIGLVPALEQLAESIRQRFNSTIAINVQINHSPLNSDLSLQLYRIAQEAMLNAARHGQAENIDVLLSKRKDKLKLIIKDDGKGFDQKKIITSSQKSHSLGLNIMLERSKRINGSFSLESKINRGTTVTVTCQINPNLKEGNQ